MKFSKKNPEFFFFFFLQNHEMAGIFTNWGTKQNHEIAGITNCEITKCGDLLYTVLWKSLNKFLGTDVSDLKVCLEYCEDPAWSCEYYEKNL